MTILILGGKGNLGSSLSQQLASDHQVVSLDKEELDVLDKEALLAAFSEIKPGVLINAVAYNAVDLCEDKANYPLALSLNAELPGRLADLCLESGCRLIHYSTDYVFSGTLEKPSFSEGDTPNPVNKYGESKFLGETEILKRARYGLSYCLIRTSKLFGPRGLSDLAKPSFFDIMLDLAQNKEEINVVSDEVSCFTYTPDLAQATERLIVSAAHAGTYHLANEGPATWYDGASELFRLARVKASLRPVRGENLLRPARRPKFSVLANTKLKRLRHWREALREYLIETGRK